MPVTADRRRRRVVVGFAFPDAASDRLAALLGSDFELVDVREAAGDEEIVLVPSSSHQLTGKMRAAFPDAALLVVEVEDLERGVGLGGQVLRTLDAGADGYFVARSVDQLAAIVGEASTATPRDGVAAPAALLAGVTDELADIVDALIVERQNRTAAATSEIHRPDGA